jgi:tetratricopeptide (TPR) repeat protein
LAPRVQNLHLRLAQVLLRLGGSDEALESLERAIELDPESERGQYAEVLRERWRQNRVEVAQILEAPGA